MKASVKYNRNDIESAKKLAEILMSYPKAMQSAKGSARFSLNQLKNILVNGRLADINRMNNALATRLRENGENPYEVIKAGKNTKIELNLSDFLNTMSNKMLRRTHENTLNAKCKYKGQNMSKANRVEKMAANGERFEQRGKKFVGVTSEGDFNAIMGEYHYYKYLTQHEKETKAQPAPEQAKQEQNAKPVDKPVQQEENSADTMEENTPAYGSDVAENVVRMANGGNREAWIDNAAEQNANESAEGKNVDNSNVEVKLTGNEFGEYKDLKELRSKAKAYYRENLQGTSVDNPILGKVNLSDNQIDFTGKGISKALSTSAKEHKLLLIRYLPQLIKNAKEVSANKNIKNKRNASQYTYLTSYAVIDGQKQPVEITIFTDVNGNR